MAALPAQPFDPHALDQFATRARVLWRLSPREAETLFHLCRGVTDSAGAAAAMGLAPSTIKNLHTATYRQLRVAEATGAVMRAWRIFEQSHRACGEEAAD